MIKQRIARGTLLNRLRELEESQKNKQAIPVLFADVEEDGQFWVGKNISDKHYFENMPRFRPLGWYLTYLIR